MKNLLYILTFVITATAVAQSSDNLNFEKQKLKQALTYGDKIVAASSMYSIINIEGPQSTYKDSLAYLYYNSRNYVSCFLVTNDILKNKPNNQELLEMSAVSLESMGALKKASETYTSLLDMTKNNFHAYKLAGLHLRMNEYDKAYSIIKQADALPDNGKMKVTYQVNKNYNQNVDLKAAIAYLEGIISLNLKKPAEAKISFQRAVNIFPEFAFAKGELAKLQ
jgi:tetratricopeptide (TPR) repeat protein